MMGFLRRTRRMGVLLRRSRLEVMLAVCFTCVTAAALFIIGTSLYLRFETLSQQQIGVDNRRLLAQINISLTDELHSMSAVAEVLYAPVLQDTYSDPASLRQSMEMLYAANRDKIVSIALFHKDGSLLSAVPRSTLQRSVAPASEKWFQDTFRDQVGLHYSLPHTQDLFASTAGRERRVMSISRVVELVRDGQSEEGVLLIDIDFSSIERFCRNASLGGEGYLYLIDQNGGILYHPRQEQLTAGTLHENHQGAAGYEDGSHLENFHGSERMITVSTLGYTGWKLVSVMPMASALAFYQPSRVYEVVLLLLVTFVMALINFSVSSRIAIPLKKLENAVRQVERGDLDTPIDIEGTYEVQHLAKAIRSMEGQMKKLMQDVVREQEAKRVSDLRVLQSQINPHFLYNTLDSIIWMIENARYDGAITMVSALARLFRIALSRGKPIISVETELEHARCYLTIQQMRFKNKFTTEIICEPDAGALPTIKLIVQPLLENAIYHGMEPMDGDGEIRVHAYCRDGGLYIDVSDNGIGIPPEKVATLLVPRTEPQESRSRGAGSGVALCNVHDRLRLTYGEPYGLTVLSEPDEGTLVRIHLPGYP